VILLAELRSCVKVEVDILGFPCLLVRTVSVDVKQHWTSSVHNYQSLFSVHPKQLVWIFATRSLLHCTDLAGVAVIPKPALSQSSFKHRLLTLTTKKSESRSLTMPGKMPDWTTWLINGKKRKKDKKKKGRKRECETAAPRYFICLVNSVTAICLILR